MTPIPGQTIIGDYSGTNHLSHVDHFHNLQTAELTRLAGTTFVGTTKDTNFWTETVANNGTVGQTGGQVLLSTLTTANGAASYVTLRKARFIPMTTNIFRSVQILNAGATNNVRQRGIMDGTDGLFFSLNGTTLNIGTKAGGAADTLVATTSWNVKPNFVLDTNIHSYEIHVSFGTADFYIDDKLVHTIEVAGTAATKRQNLNLPITLSNINSGGGTTACTMSVILATVARVGKLQTAPTFFHGTTAATTVLKYGAGMLHRLTINNASGTLITIYDNTAASGTVIAVISTPVNANPVTLDYGIGFSNGLTIVTTGTWDYTIQYE